MLVKFGTNFAIMNDNNSKVYHFKEVVLDDYWCTQGNQKQ